MPSLILLALLGCVSQTDGTYKVTLTVNGQECVEDDNLDVNTDEQVYNGLMSVYHTTNDTLVMKYLSVIMTGSEEKRTFSVSHTEGWTDVSCGVSSFNSTYAFDGEFGADLGMVGTMTITEEDKLENCSSVPDTNSVCTTTVGISGIRLNSKPDAHALNSQGWGYIPNFGY